MKKKEFQKKLGKHIVELRKAKKWSQSELARQCEKDRQNIERLENGKTNPTAFYLYEIATALEISVEELFKGL